MKTKKKYPATDIKPEIPAIPVSDSSSNVTETETEKVARISIPLTNDGKIAWDSLRDSTQEKLKTIIAGEKVSVEQAPAAQVEVFNEQWCGVILDTVGKIESFAAQKLNKIPADIAERAFTYSDLEKEKLAGPMARVINKYAPVWLESYKDEVALAMLFVTITMVKLQMAKALMEMEAQKKKQSFAIVPEKPAEQEPIP